MFPTILRFREPTGPTSIACENGNANDFFFDEVKCVGKSVSWHAGELVVMQEPSNNKHTALNHIDLMTTNTLLEVEQ